MLRHGPMLTWGVRLVQEAATSCANWCTGEAFLRGWKQHPLLVLIRFVGFLRPGHAPGSGRVSHMLFNGMAQQ